jgi:hypothetical protein
MNPFLANTTFPIRIQPTVDILAAMLVIHSGANVPHQVGHISTQLCIPSSTGSRQGHSCHTIGYSWRCCTFVRTPSATFATAGIGESGCPYFGCLALGLTLLGALTQGLITRIKTMLGDHTATFVLRTAHEIAKTSLAFVISTEVRACLLYIRCTYRKRSQSSFLSREAWPNANTSMSDNAWSNS